jgi:hypothetical protein
MTEESRVPLYAASAESRERLERWGAPSPTDINRRGDTLSAGPVTSPSDTCYRFKTVDCQQGEGSRLAKDTENGGSLIDASARARAHVASREHERKVLDDLPVLQRFSRELSVRSRVDSPWMIRWSRLVSPIRSIPKFLLLYRRDASVRGSSYVLACHP